VSASAKPVETIRAAAPAAVSAFASLAASSPAFAAQARSVSCRAPHALLGCLRGAQRARAHPIGRGLALRRRPAASRGAWALRARCCAPSYAPGARSGSHPSGAASSPRARHPFSLPLPQPHPPRSTHALNRSPRATSHARAHFSFQPTKQELSQVANEVNILGVVAVAFFIMVPVSFLLILFIKSNSEGNQSGGFSQEYYDASYKRGDKKAK
jgi:photosystem II reaction center protein PsbM